MRVSFPSHDLLGGLSAKTPVVSGSVDPTAQFAVDTTQLSPPDLSRWNNAHKTLDALGADTLTQEQTYNAATTHTPLKAGGAIVTAGFSGKLPGQNMRFPTLSEPVPGSGKWRRISAHNVVTGPDGKLYTVVLVKLNKGDINDDNRWRGFTVDGEPYSVVSKEIVADTLSYLGNAETSAYTIVADTDGQSSGTVPNVVKYPALQAGYEYTDIGTVHTIVGDTTMAAIRGEGGS